MQRGVHFMLDADQAAAFDAASGDDDRLVELVEALEEALGQEATSFCESDKAWDPISCALAPSGPDRDPQDWPWTGVVLGQRSLQADDDELLVSLLDPASVAEVSEALDTLDEETFAEAYAQMPAELRNPEYSDDECAYAWEYLSDLIAFFGQARSAGAHVLFHVGH